MSEAFLKALKHSLQFEGGYANDPADSGGETFRGVSRRNWPRWGGWALIDEAKAAGCRTASAINSRFASHLVMEQSVADFYRANFWNPVAAFGAPPRLTAKLFDTSINLGLKGAVIVLQRALNQTGTPAPLAEDGAFGPRTRAALNLALSGHNAEGRLLFKFAEMQKDYYQRIVDRKPSQAKFLNGWLRRAAWIPE